MMNRSELRRLNFHLKRMDYALRALPNGNHVAIYENRNGTNRLVFALTDNWTVQGFPVRWGVEPIQERLRMMDCWHHRPFEDMLKHNQKREESAQRDFDNKTESFLYDFKSQFAKATNDINTSTLEKIDRRKINGDRKS